ncbi:MAG: hypothetical protein KatS3mg110_0444 [Pirellulaceae bacterium]|nr:MAG: hypothetical protein KatS3mg110_0444 [Pirellulaceae bacterium]
MRHKDAQTKVRVGLLYGVASLLGRIAHADGRIDPREVQLSCLIIGEIAEAIGLNMNESEIKTLVESAFQSDEGVDIMLQLCREDENFRAAMIRYGWRIAAKDGHISPEEVRVLFSVAELMNASPVEIQTLSLPYYRLDSADEDERRRAAASTLGVSKDANANEIKAAYRTLAQKYHPDRHVTAPPELRELAAERFAAIHNAYETLMAKSTTPQLYGLVAEIGELSTVGTGDMVYCFLCSTKCRLPPVEHHSTARCPKCQALLLFEQKTAELLKSCRG